MNKNTMPHSKETTVKVKQSSPLLEYLQIHFPERKRSLLKKVLGGKQIKVNGSTISAFDHPLNKGDELHISWQKPIKKPATQLINLLHEDEDLIAINKPAGLLSIQGKTPTTKTAYHQVKNYLREQHGASNLFVIHRLDKDVSGILLFAKNKRCADILKTALDEGNINFSFTAISEGGPTELNGTLHHWLKESKALKMHASDHKNNGKEALTLYRIVRSKGKYIFWHLNPQTHRKNQLRVQLSHIGFPVLGDKKYGATTNPINRLALHASRLEFNHPASGEKLLIQCKVPAKFKHLN